VKEEGDARWVRGQRQEHMILSVDESIHWYNQVE